MKILFLLLILAIYFSIGNAQAPLVKQWDARFGGLAPDAFNCFQETIDAGFILGGYSSSNIGGDKTENSKGGSDYWVVKIDSLGNKQWDKDFGGNSEDYLSSIYQTIDGGFILGGTSRSDSGGDKTYAPFGYDDFWIIKIDSLGNKQWDKVFGGDDFEGLTSIIQTRDSGYLLGGYTYSGVSGNKTEPLLGGPGDNDYWIIKTDGSGNKLWEKDFGGTQADALTSLLELDNGGYLLAGTSISGVSIYKSQPSQGMSDYWIIKTDINGNIEWDKDFGGSNDDALNSIEEISDAGFILHGSSNSGISGDKSEDNWDITGQTNDIWIIKIDSLGIKIWDKDYGGFGREDNPGKITQTQDGGYFISSPSTSNAGGDKSQNNLGLFQTWTLKLDSLGNKVWDKTVFTLGTNRYNNLSTQTRDGCYVIACDDSSAVGGEKSFDSWNHSYDFWITKFCDTTLININSVSLEPISIFPNPVNNILKISSHHSIINLKIFNILGIIDVETSKVGNEIDISSLLPGLYFIQLKTQLGIRTFKIVKA